MSVVDRPPLATAAHVAAAPALGTHQYRIVAVAMRAFRYLRTAYSLDLRSLTLFRIALAAVLLGDLIARSFDLTVFYTDWGILPLAALLDKFALPGRFSLLLMS